MKKLLITGVTVFLIVCVSIGQNLKQITIDQDISGVQPMTGIVLWPTNSKINTDVISLEYSYMSYAEVVVAKDTYDWIVVEELLDEIASRNHQAVLRFRFSYPGKTTTVPQYIKDLSDYEETQGISEGNTTWFPDWTHEELQRCILDFYEKFAANYDQDPRLAFVQTGFGLWAEYHIYDGPFVLGETFPSMEYQEEFFNKMASVFVSTTWSISIDAAGAAYSPFETKSELKDINFGLFDDSFMHKDHANYNESSWNFFDRNRYQWAPAGGEFSYYSTYDQQSVLIPDTGAYGESFESAVERFHMSYILGNDQTQYQSIERIAEASRYMGYKFKINSFKSGEGHSVVEVENVGVAPFYSDAFVTVNGVRASESLKLLLPGHTIVCNVAAGSNDPVLTIESDQILETQTISYYGTENTPYAYEPSEVLGVNELLDSNYSISMDSGRIKLTAKQGFFKEVYVYTLHGKIVFKENEIESKSFFSFKLNSPEGLCILMTNLGNMKLYTN
ncbi:DUF4832 domain-containing protein [Reichenbachiella faecimaris]|uniref:DUF4832 domain-containing protein n=1 Tax=Reichenbachiella faecimaris TaxID=692418 RepID=UPI00111C6711|nr:DUF4832 domain-containing protein [Reichenbachiella faecimaris]